MSDIEADVSQPLRVLFLGSNISPMSVAVLDAITATDEFAVTILVPRRPLSKTMRQTWKTYGPRTLLRGALRMGRSALRVTLRRWGLIKGDRFHAMAEIVQRRGVDVVPVDGLHTPETLATVEGLQPDVLLIAVFDRILKRPLLAIPRLGAVNVHPSLLPAFRGPNPVYWVIEEGATKTGVTFHVVDEGVDTGDVLAQRELDVLPAETEPALRKRCGELAGEMAADVLRGLRDGTLEPKPQSDEHASHQGHAPRGRSRI